jgi:hypothetical protein
MHALAVGDPSPPHPLSQGGAEREAWLVSTHFEASGGGGGGGGLGPSGPHVLGSVAVCLGLSQPPSRESPREAPAGAPRGGSGGGGGGGSGGGGLNAVRPVPPGPAGLFAPVALPRPATAGAAVAATGGQAAPPPGHSLGALPFLVMGSFHLARSHAHGRHVLQSLFGSPSPSSAAGGAVGGAGGAADAGAGAAAGAAAAARASGGPSPLALATAGALPAHAAQRAEHNLRVLDAVAAAWLHAFQWLCGGAGLTAGGPGGHDGGPGGGGGPGGPGGGRWPEAFDGDRGMVYEAMLPDLGAARAARDELAMSCIRQVLDL